MTTSVLFWLVAASALSTLAGALAWLARPHLKLRGPAPPVDPQAPVTRTAQ